MAGKEVHHHHGDTFNQTGRDGSNFAQKSREVSQTSNINKPHITVTADQRQIISSVLDEMLRLKANLPGDVLEAVYNVREVVKADAANPTEKTQSLLSKVWADLKDVTEFTSHMTDIGGFVIEHQAAIVVAITAAAQLLQ